MTTKETLAKKSNRYQVEMYGKKGKKRKQTLANVDETPSHALDVVLATCGKYRSCLEPGCRRRWCAQRTGQVRASKHRPRDRVSQTDVFCLCERCVLCREPCLPTEASKSAMRCT